MTSFRYQNQPCTLLSSRTLFGREVCTVYLAESGRVLELGREDLVGFWEILGTGPKKIARKCCYAAILAR